MDTLAVHCSHYGLCPDYIYYNLEVLQMVEVTRSNSLSLSLSLSESVYVQWRPVRYSQLSQEG